MLRTSELNIDMDLAKVNKKAQVRVRDTKKPTELEIGKEYIISHLKCIKTRFGTTAIAVLENCEFDVYLPKRIATEIEPYLEEFEKERYSLIYEGLVDTPTYGNIASLKFNKK